MQAKWNIFQRVIEILHGWVHLKGRDLKFLNLQRTLKFWSFITKLKTRPGIKTQTLLKAPLRKGYVSIHFLLSIGLQ